jgi:hypothetical protein
MTVGLGEELYARFGHTMLHIDDRENGIDYVVNWGMFDFDDPAFVVKFFKGILMYRMGFSTYGSTLQVYRYDRRSMWEDPLNLTALQKQKLLDKIRWNARPENLVYPYQYFRSNCSTIPRDYLDMALDGAIRKKYGEQITSITYRDYVRNNLSINPLIGWALDILFNGDNDARLTAWQEMYYPLQLRENLQNMQALDDSGNPVISGEPLVGRGKELLFFRAPDPGHVTVGYWIIVLLTGLPLLLVVLANIKLLWKRSASIHFLRLLGISTIAWGLIAGFFGVTHIFAWLWSEHTDLHRNVNMFLFWPFDVIWVWLGGVLLWAGRWPLQSVWARRTTAGYCVLHIIFALLFLMIDFKQNVELVRLYMVPLLVSFYAVWAGLILRVGQAELSDPPAKF